VLLAAVVATAATTAGMLGASALEAAPARADIPAPACARTTDATVPASPAPGVPCWTDVDPYPFGTDGNPVDTTSPTCRPPAPPWQSVGDQLACYLKVDSLAFRAWNRGLAATSPITADASSTTAFGVWYFNGTRWFPDPTFPGQSVCKGNTVLWAGKRDYWLVGARVKNWPTLCRFDGVNFEWQPLDVPRATLDRVPLDVNGQRNGGAINAGACSSWDNCWFFGTYGVVVHWDGNVLTDASPDLDANPWLRTEYLAAVARSGATGGSLGFAVGTTGGSQKGDQLPAQPGGAPPPQLYGSTGGSAFSPLSLSPPTHAQPGDPYRTDLVAVDADAQGRGWVAGVPVGYRAGYGLTPGNPSSTDRRVATSEPSPLVRISPEGAPMPCAGTPPDRFAYANTRDGNDAYLWSSISAFPAGGDALAGGQMRPATAGTSLNDDGSREPVLVHASCDGPPIVTRFRLPDPTYANPATAPLVPADRRGTVTGVAANAVNDAWAATTHGIVLPPSDPTGQFSADIERPHLYRLTDTQPPLAPAGDDDEPRPLVFEPDPPIFVEAPPDPEPPAPPDTTVAQPGPTTTKRIKLKPAIYNVKARVRTSKGGTITLELSFRVRRKVTIGAQALRRSTVVSSTGLKRFKAPRGKLALKLDRRHWPTRIRFVSPRPAPRPTVAPKQPATGGAHR
jgi:hypothetical protein